MFSVRIVTTDHYQAAPLKGLDVCYNDARGSDVYKVPVIRVYGATPAGQKTCMHVHGVFPYIYVPYDGSLPVDRFLRQFASSVDKALNVAMGRASSSVQHVYKVTLVSGIPFYGYHEEEQAFVKIYLYNPLMVKKVADLLLGGAIMNKVFQPYEAHIPYMLQMFIDYNLYGMNLLNVGAVKFRHPLKDDNANPKSDPSTPEDSDTSPSIAGSFCSLEGSFQSNSPSILEWDHENIPSELLLDASVTKQSTCSLEVDVVAPDILNRLEVGDNIGSNPGLAALWEDEKQRRRQKGQSSQSTPPSSPDRGHIPWAPAEEALQQRLQDIMQDLQPFLSEDESDEGSEDDLTPQHAALTQVFPATPSSEVEVHLSQASASSSPSTVILEEDEEGEDRAIINEHSILRVISSSQSFREDLDNSQLPVSSQDQSLANLLAALAEDNDSPAASQIAAQISALEEQDSILSQHSVGDSQPGSLPKDEEDEIDVESQEMSQKMWENTTEETQNPSGQSLEYDLAGMDQSWNSSQWHDVTRSPPKPPVIPVDVVPETDSSEDEWGDSIPQVDGPTDSKSDEPKPRRLGMRGPTVITQQPRPVVKAGRSTILPLRSFHIRAETYEGKRTPPRSGLCYEQGYINGGMTRTPKPNGRHSPISSDPYRLGLDAPSKKMNVSLDLRTTQMFVKQSPRAVLPEPAEKQSPRAVIQEPAEPMPTFIIESSEEQLTKTGTSSSLPVTPVTPSNTTIYEIQSSQDKPTVHKTRKSRLKTKKLQTIKPGEQQAASPNQGRSTYVQDYVPGSNPNAAVSPSVVIRPGNVIRQTIQAKSGKSTTPTHKKSQSLDLRSVSTGSSFKQMPAAKPKNKDWASAITGMDQLPPGKQKVKLQSPTQANAPVPESGGALEEPSEAPEGAGSKPDDKENQSKSKRNRLSRKHIPRTSESSKSGEPADIPEMVHKPRQKTRRSPEKKVKKVSERRGSKADSEKASLASPERDNIFTMLTQNLSGSKEVPAPASVSKNRGGKEPDKAIDESGVAKIAQGLRGFKKNLFKGPEELKQIHEKLNTPGSKNTPVVVESQDNQMEEAAEIVAPQESPELDEKTKQFEKEWLEKNRIKRLKKRRRRHSSKSSHAGSSKGNRTGSEREMSDVDVDPEDYIVFHRGSSDSSAESDDDSVEMRVHVGAHQKTYEKPSYRVGSNFGKAPLFNETDSSRKFDEIFSKQSDEDDDEGEPMEMPFMIVESANQSNDDIHQKEDTTLDVNEEPKLSENHESKKALDNEEIIKSNSETNTDNEPTLNKVTEKKLYKGIKFKPSKLPKKPPPDINRLLISRTSPVKYSNGIFSAPPENETPKIVSKVRVLKEDLDEHDFDQVGSENIVLWKMNTTEINELRSQVKKEMEHKRTEHIMPLIMQKSQDEIESEYAQVKKRVLEELAKEPPMPEYIDSDLESFGDSSEQSSSDKESSKSKSSSYNDDMSADKSDEMSINQDSSHDENSHFSSDDEMPTLEPAYSGDEPKTNVASDTQFKNDDLDESIEVIDIVETQDAPIEESDAEVVGETDLTEDVGETALTEDVTFVIVSKEEACAEVLGAEMVIEQTEDEQLVTNDHEDEPDNDVSVEPEEEDSAVDAHSTEDVQSQENLSNCEVTEITANTEELNESKEDIVIIDLDAHRKIVQDEMKGDLTALDKIKEQEKAMHLVESKSDQIEGTSEKSKFDNFPKHESDSLRSLEIKSSRPGSRHSSVDTNTDKGDMAEVDFSLLEMDTDNDPAEGSMQHSELDTPRQLHTPPIVIDNDSDQLNEHLVVTPQKDEPVDVPDSIDNSVLLDSSLMERDQSGKLSSFGLIGSGADETDGSQSGSASGRDFTGIKDIPAASRKRKSYEQSDHYRFRDKRLHTDYTKSAITRVVSDTSRSSSTSSSPTHKKPRGRPRRKPEQVHGCSSDKYESSATDEDDSHRIFAPASENVVNKEDPVKDILCNQIRPVAVVLERIEMSGVSVKLHDKKRRWSAITQEPTKVYPKGIMTDVVTENQIDPLWEAHRRRLSVLGSPCRPQTAKRQKGPPRKQAEIDQHAQTSTPIVMKKPTPKKKTKDPFVRTSNKRMKKRSGQKKFFDKLSLLHQYTLDSLSSIKDGSDGQGSIHSEDGSSCSNTGSGSGDASPSHLSTKDVANYSRDVDDDHKTSYDDVMYKLALLSPPEQESRDKSPPRPASPTQAENEACDTQTGIQDVPRHESAGGSMAHHMSHDPDFDVVEETQLSQMHKEDILPRIPGKENVPYAVKTEVVRFSANGPKPVEDSSFFISINHQDTPNTTPPPDLGPPQCTMHGSPENSLSNISPPKLLSETTCTSDKAIPEPLPLKISSIDVFKEQRSEGNISSVPTEFPQFSGGNVESSDKPNAISGEDCNMPSNPSSSLQYGYISGGNQYDKNHIPGICSPKATSPEPPIENPTRSAQSVLSTTIPTPTNEEECDAPINLTLKPASTSNQRTGQEWDWSKDLNHQNIVVEQNTNTTLNPSNNERQFRVLDTPDIPLGIHLQSESENNLLQHSDDMYHVIRCEEDPRSPSPPTLNVAPSLPVTTPISAPGSPRTSSSPIRPSAPPALTCSSSPAAPLNLSQPSNWTLDTLVSVTNTSSPPGSSDACHLSSVVEAPKTLTAQASKETKAIHRSHLPFIEHASRSSASKSPSPVSANKSHSLVISPRSSSSVRSPMATASSPSPFSTVTSPPVATPRSPSPLATLDSPPPLTTPESPPLATARSSQFTKLRSTSPIATPRSPSPLATSRIPPTLTAPTSTSSVATPASPIPTMPLDLSEGGPASPPGSPSPPRSPSPIRSPDPHRVLGSGHTPAVIPLTIEDPEIQEEVEKARRYKLMKLLGRGSQSSSKSRQIQRQLLKERLLPMAVQSTATTAGEQDNSGPGTSSHQTETSNAGQSVSSQDNYMAQMQYYGNMLQTFGGDNGGPGPSGVNMPRNRETVVIHPSLGPPSREDISRDAVTHGLGDYQAQDAFCSNPEDVPDRPR